MKTLYEILDLTKEADPATIKQRYRKLSRQYHPDRNPGDKEALEKYNEIQEAYEVLSDPIRKSIYDRTGKVTKAASNEEMEFANVVLPLMNGILKQVVDNDSFRGGIQTVDMLSSIKVEVSRQIIEIDQSIAIFEKMKKYAEYTGKRYKTKEDKTNVLADLTKSTISQCEAEIEALKQLHDLHKRVLKMLDSYIWDGDNLVRERIHRQLTTYTDYWLT